MKTATKAKEKKILKDHLAKYIKRGAQESKGAMKIIDKEGKLLTDHVATIGTASGGKPQIVFESNGALKAKIGRKKMTLHPHGVVQAGAKLGIPTAFIKELAYGEKWQRDLAATNLNEHSKNTDRSRVLIRSVGNEIRGVLSDSYRRLSTPQLYNSFLAEVKKQGGQVVRANVDDTRSWVETILPQIVYVPTKHNGEVGMVFGMRISNSDFGDGALDIRAFNIQVVCMNGMVRENLMRQIHLGRKLPDDLSLSERTYQLDTATQASLIQDMVRTVYNTKTIMNQAQGIQKAASKLIDVDAELIKLPKVGVQKGEVEAVQKVLLQNNPKDGVQGDPTMWKLSQAVTSVAQKVDQRRKRELEEIGGKLLETV